MLVVVEMVMLNSWDCAKIESKALAFCMKLTWKPTPTGQPPLGGWQRVCPWVPSTAWPITTGEKPVPSGCYRKCSELAVDVILRRWITWLTRTTAKVVGSVLTRCQISLGSTMMNIYSITPKIISRKRTNGWGPLLVHPWELLGVVTLYAKVAEMNRANLKRSRNVYMVVDLKYKNRLGGMKKARSCFKASTLTWTSWETVFGVARHAWVTVSYYLFQDWEHVASVSELCSRLP